MTIVWACLFALVLPFQLQFSFFVFRNTSEIWNKPQHTAPRSVVRVAPGCFQICFGARAPHFRTSIRPGLFVPSRSTHTNITLADPTAYRPVINTPNCRHTIQSKERSQNDGEQGGNSTADSSCWRGHPQSANAWQRKGACKQARTASKAAKKQARTRRAESVRKEA